MAKKTQPPRRYTEATLLSAMESAGRALSDEDMRAAMKDSGLGTPATRAAIIETLLKRGYARREQKLLAPTEMGMALITALPVRSLASPELTGAWEARLARVARREESAGRFMADIAEFVREAVGAIRASSPAMATAKPPTAKSPPTTKLPQGKLPQAKLPRAKNKTPKAKRKTKIAVGELVCPRCQLGRMLAGRRGWGCTRWREGCSFVVWFETAGRRLTEAQLADLVQRGRTRKSKGDSARLVLDVNVPGGARLERDA